MGKWETSVLLSKCFQNEEKGHIVHLRKLIEIQIGEDIKSTVSQDEGRRGLLSCM